MAWQRCNTGIPLNDKWSKAVRSFSVLDATTGAHVPGSPMSFSFGDDSTADKWPALVRAKLKASPLGEYLRLGTETAVDGDIDAEKTVDFWRTSKPLRINIGGFEETDKATTWSCALRQADGTDATLAQMMEAFVPAPPGGTGKRTVRLTLCDKSSGRELHLWECELNYKAGADDLLTRVAELAATINEHIQVNHAIHDYGKALSSKSEKKQWTLSLPDALKLEVKLSEVDSLAGDQTSGWIACNTGIPLNDKWSKAVRSFSVLDAATGAHVPGSPMSFSFGDASTADKWPALVRAKLKASPLGDYLRLGTETAVDGDIDAEKTVDFWRTSKPLRINIGGFEETDKAATWSCALRQADGTDATLAQLMEAFAHAPSGGTGKRGVRLSLSDRENRRDLHHWECELTYTTGADNLLTRVDELANSIKAHIQLNHAIHDYGKAVSSKDDKKQWTLSLPSALQLELKLSQLDSLSAGQGGRWVACNTGIPLNDKWSKAVRVFQVYDDSTGSHVPGSPLSFSFGDNSTHDRWPALVRAKLAASPLGEVLRLGTQTSVDGDIASEGTVDFWHADKPLRVFIGGFEEVDKVAAWSCALQNIDGTDATLADLMDAATPPPEGGTGSRQVKFELRDKISRRPVRSWTCELQYATGKDNLLARIETLANSIEANIHVEHAIHDKGKARTSKLDKNSWTLSLPSALLLDLNLEVEDGPVLHDDLCYAWGTCEALVDADNDSLPNMTGLESAQLGAGQEVWRSFGYLLADRNLQVGEHIHAWVVDVRDGSIVKHVAWKADEANLTSERWPKAFLTAVNAAPADKQGYKWLTAGHLTLSGELQLAEKGSTTTVDFTTLTSSDKADLDRIWVYGNGYRLFTNAPFVANQAIVSRLMDVPPLLNETISVQVRDRTTLHLYETYLFKPSTEDDVSSTSWGQGLSTYINSKHFDARYGMLRAGVLASDGVTISPAASKNALWVAQHSNLSVELDTLVWQKYRTVGAFTPRVGQVLQIRLYDRYSSAQLPGSPLCYTVKSTDTDATKCLVSLAKALHASELGDYLRLGTPGAVHDTPTAATGWVLWHMPLPVKVIVTGELGLTGDHEPGLETQAGKPLNLGGLYNDFKDGLTLVLSDRWSGSIIESWDYTPAAAASTTEDEDARRAAWVEGLGTLLASSFVMWGTRTALLNAPDLKASDLADQSLWLPTDAESVLVARHPEPAAALGSEGRPKLEQQIIYKRDRLIWDEVQRYGYFTVWSAETDYPALFSKLLAWGDEVLSASDIDQTRPRYTYTPTSFETVLPADFQSKASSANAPALVASRLSRDDMFCMHYDVWQLQYPSKQVTQCLRNSNDHLVIQFTPPDHDYLYILAALRLILASRDGRLPSDKSLDTATHKIMRSGWLRSVLDKLKEIDALEPGDERLSQRVDSLVTNEAKSKLSNFVEVYAIFYEKKSEDHDSPGSQESSLQSIGMDSSNAKALNAFINHSLTIALKTLDADIFDKLAYGSATDSTLTDIKAQALRVAERWVLGLDLHPLSEAVWANVKALGKLKAEHELLLTQLLCGEQRLNKHHLHLQLTPEAQKKGIRFIDYTPDFSPDIRRLNELTPSSRAWNGGIRLHIPDGVTIARTDGLCSASYINRSGIAPAYKKTTHSQETGTTPLTIEMPFKGRKFIPNDSLCADYAGTLGSELYDVSGASENGVDNKTGLFHAHYPVGVIRGLAGNGPELDLTLHYSATRANESALGDGWAFRFSVYDNRLHRLTLHNGQTVPLSAAQLENARGSKRLAINGITLTGAQGDHGALTGLTVIFPSGRTETLAKPDPHDGKEASEHYKTAFVKKVKALKSNLEQWLKESGVTKEQTRNINDRIKELTKLETEMKRKAYLLVPTSIMGARGGTLKLTWEGKAGHVHLQTIADGEIKLLTAVHGTPVAEGEYSSTFTVWPDTDEAYTVALSIKDCLLTRLTRQGKSDAAPVQSVVFGYEGEPVLDRVLCSVAEEDGSLESVSYGPMWKHWESNSDNTIPLSKVLRHTLLPGAGQEPITHIWEWQGSSSLLMKEGATFSSTCSIDTGSHLQGQSTTRTWALKNGFIVETQVVEEVPGLARETTIMAYPDTVASTDPAVRFRLATQPVSTTVTTEDLRVSTQPTSALNSAAEGSVEESH